MASPISLAIFDTPCYFYLTQHTAQVRGIRGMYGVQAKQWYGTLVTIGVIWSAIVVNYQLLSDPGKKRSIKVKKIEAINHELLLFQLL